MILVVLVRLALRKPHGLLPHTECLDLSVPDPTVVWLSDGRTMARIKENEIHKGVKLAIKCNFDTFVRLQKVPPCKAVASITKGVGQVRD
jgi:hypothetical protein